MLYVNLSDHLFCCKKQVISTLVFGDAIIIVHYKNKGGMSDCSNYREDNLLSIAGYVIARILQSCLVPTIAVENIPMSQCGFRSNRFTTDMVLVLHILLKKYQRHHNGIHASFANPTITFDSVRRIGQLLMMIQFDSHPSY